VIKVSGPDRQSFLQGQLTQDTLLITPAQPLLAGWPNAKGRLNFVAWLLSWQEALWLVLPAELVDTAVQRLRMYVLRAQVRVEAVPAAVTFGPPTSFAHIDETGISNCFYSENEYWFSPVADPERGLHIALNAVPAATADTAEWQRAIIEAGVPSVFAATREHFVPQMLNLDLLGAISFTKGCYIGQEIVARTQHLGRIKRRMYRFTAGAAAEPGAPVYAGGKAVGEVVNAVTVDGRCMLLAAVRIESLAERLSLDAAGEYLLRRQPLAYHVPDQLTD
jgi:folate-binding protein YgfZ